MMTETTRRCEQRTTISQRRLRKSSILFSLIFLLHSPTVYAEGRPNARPDTRSCCRSKGVNDTCVGLFCDLERPPNEFDAFEIVNMCPQYLTPIAACLADGRNHTGCCRKEWREPHDNCMHLCDGSAYTLNVTQWEDANYRAYVTCLSLNVQSIFQCFSDGYTLAPGPPQRPTADDLTPTSAGLSWEPPQLLPSLAARYAVFYAPMPRTATGAAAGRQLKLNFRRAVAENGPSARRLRLERLTPDTRYRAYVVAEAADDHDDQRRLVSLPSEYVDFVTVGVAPRVDAYKSKVQAMPKTSVTLVCVVNLAGSGEQQTLDVHWYFGRSSRSFGHSRLSTNGGKYEQTTRPSRLGGGGGGADANAKRVYVSALTVSRLDTGDYGFYKCQARTDDGESSTVLELQKANVVRAPPSPPNVTECCVREGVQGKCAAMCESNVDEPINMGLFQGAGTCVQDLPKVMQCSMGPSDPHRGLCCLRRGVPLECLFLCDTSRAASQQAVFNCMPYTDDFLQCVMESKRNLPWAPSDLRVTQQSGDTATLEWSADGRPDDVVTFHLFYKKTHEVGWQRLASNTGAAVIANLGRNSQYTAQVLATNAAGSSDPSRPVSFSTGNFRSRDQPSRRRKSRNNRHSHHSQRQHSQVAEVVAETMIAD